MTMTERYRQEKEINMEKTTISAKRAATTNPKAPTVNLALTSN